MPFNPKLLKKILTAPKDINNEQIIQLCTFHVVVPVHRTEKGGETFRMNKRIVELGVFLAATFESPEMQDPSESL